MSDNVSIVTDLTDPKFIKLKYLLFLLPGFHLSGLLLIHAADWTVALLMVTMIWGLCSFYSFVFYGIQHYVDPRCKFSGLWGSAQYVMGRQKL